MNKLCGLEVLVNLRFFYFLHAQEWTGRLAKARLVPNEYRCAFHKYTGPANSRKKVLFVLKLPLAMNASSEEEEIYKRVRTAKKHDDLDNLFEEKSETPSNVYDEAEPANLEEIFGTGHEYDYIYEVEEKEERAVEDKHEKAYVAYSDVLRYAKNNGIHNTEIIKKLYDGYDVNFIALHCINTFEGESGERMSIYDIYRTKRMIDNFPAFYRLKQMVQGVFSNRIWTVDGIRQLLMYEKYEDACLKGVLRTDDFAENLFFEDKVSVPEADEEDSDALNDLLREHSAEKDAKGFSAAKDSVFARCDREENTVDERQHVQLADKEPINTSGRAVLRERIRNYVLKMSKHPYLSTYAKKYFDSSTLRNKLYYYFGVSTDGEPTRNDRLRKMIINQVVALMDDSKEEARERSHPTFTAILDVILNTGVRRPTENDTYLCMTEDKGHAKIVVMNFLGNMIKKLSVRNTEEKIKGVIRDVRPKYIFITGCKTVLRFFYSSVIEWTGKLKEVEGIGSRVMYADPFYPVYSRVRSTDGGKGGNENDQNGKCIERAGSYGLDKDVAAVGTPLNGQDSVEDVFSLLLHVGRRCLYPEIELMHMVGKKTLPYFVKDRSLGSFSAARRALTLGLGIVGIDLNYLVKCDRARIISKFVPFFNTDVMRSLVELGFVSRLEILRENLCKSVEMETYDETFICFNKIENEVLFNNVCTYLRVYHDTFNITDRFDRLDELLVHPVNYRSARLICAAAMGRDEVDEDNNNNFVIALLNDKGAPGELNMEKLRQEKDSFDVLNVMMYERREFKGLCDSKVFEMLVGEYDDHGVYVGSVIKVCDRYLIVRVCDNWCVAVRRDGECYANPGDDQTGVAREYFENDEVKVRIKEKNILGLSFRGEIANETQFFLQNHPLYVNCTARAAESILRQRRQLLLLRKSGTKPYGVITLQITDEIFVHYKIEKDNSGVIFNNRQYENVDHVIYCYFREMVKLLTEIKNDRDYGEIMRFSKKRPGYLEIGDECVCVGSVLRRGGEMFGSVGELKERLGVRS